MSNRCRGKPEDFIGKVFGHLKIIWVNEDGTCSCRCDCSNIATLPFKEVIYGRKKTCGCRKRGNLRLSEGMIIRGVRLIRQVEDEVYKTGRKRRWLVECVNCKNQRVLREYDLTSQKVSICPKCKAK